MSLHLKFKAYYLTAILSLVFAVLGFTYNTWRLEVSEDNNIIRTASFEVLKELAKLERVIYASYYDKDKIAGNPRIAWVKVGLISDLSTLISKDVENKANNLKAFWSKNWDKTDSNEQTVNQLVIIIDSVRVEIRTTLSTLK